MAEDVFGLVGTTIQEKYLIQSLVGEGGFSVVYRAVHRHLGQPAALKVLKIPAHFDAAGRQGFVEFFCNEGRILSKLADHPAIVRVLDFGTIDGSAQPLFYLALEWLEGRDLEALLAEAAPAFSEADAIRLLRPVIEALALAHSEGIAHRDLKPANLYLAQTKLGPRIKVLDFGIAKAMQEGERRTQLSSQTSSGFHAFTPDYGAPEQFRPRKHGATGTWTDVHALALILVELVTGRAALDGEELADFLLASTDPRRPTPRARGAHVSDGFESVCRRALALEPRERYQNASELLAALDALEEAGGLVAAEPSPGGGDVAARAPAKATVPLDGWLATQISPAVNAFDLVAQEPEPHAFFTPRAVEKSKGTPPGVAAPVPAVGLETTAARATRGRAALWLGIVAAVGLGSAVFVAMARRAENAEERPRERAGAGPGAAAPPQASTRPPTPPASTAPSDPALPDTVLLPAGEFSMGSNGGDADERPVHRVLLRAFELDTTEVTVGAYADCYRRGPCSAPGVDGLCNWGRPDRAHHPVNCVDVHQADTYCHFNGKRLPSEEELEYAAAGPEGRTFPWGEEPPNDDRLCWGRRDGSCAVGSRPAGATVLGVHDLAGNVSEWTATTYCDSYSANRICVSGRVYRGSSFIELRPEVVRNAHRDENDPSTRSPYLGFRCARSH